MKILPVTTVNNISNRGRLSNKTSELTKIMSNGWLETVNSGKYKTLPMINSCIFASERINNIHMNLLTIMERFGQACELTFAKSEKSGIYRFFINNKYSNYKLMCGDIKFSDKMNKLSDIDKLEEFEKNMEKIDPYKENSNFIIQRKSSAKSPLYDNYFEPSFDYIFLEDKLVGKEPLPEATLKDIKEFIEAAKEDGVI